MSSLRDILLNEKEAKYKRMYIVCYLSCKKEVYEKTYMLLCKRNTGKINQELIRLLPVGFPGGAVVESLPASAGDIGSSPGLGRSRVPRSGWAREPRLLSLRVWSLCSSTGGAAVVRGPRTAMRSGPCLPQLEKALAQKRRPNTAINK